MSADAKRWMDSPHWGGWRVGMVSDSGAVFIQHTYGVVEHFCEPDTPEPWVADAGSGEDAVPDLNHPGTLAFLLEDVRKAWGYGRLANIEIRYYQFGTMLLVEYHEGRAPVNSSWTGYHEALLAALEAAP